MLRKIILFMALMALSLIVVACGTSKNDQEELKDKPVIEDNKDDDETESIDETNPEQDVNADNQEEMQKKMDELDYVEFELEVDYANHDEYEAELEKNSDNSIDAKVEDSINMAKKKGTEAFNDLYPLVKQLTIGQETSKEEAINEVLTIFNLDINYSKFEVDITFKDGTKIEFEDKK